MQAERAVPPALRFLESSDLNRASLENPSLQKPHLNLFHGTEIPTNTGFIKKVGGYRKADRTEKCSDKCNSGHG